MAELYGQLPHEIALGRRDEGGKTYHPGWHRFDVQCTHMLMKQRAKAQSQVQGR